MHPAKSVILFTTASGAGYGLLAWIGLLGAFGLLPVALGFALSAFGLGFGLVVLGLLSSTFHLGHPERAWRALSQWRSSWLSREGVAAAFTFLPAGLFALAWVLFGQNDALVGLLGLLTALSCLVTMACTAMIYASLKTIRAWTSRWTLPNYLLLGLLSGGVLLQPVLMFWQAPIGLWFAIALLVLFALAFLAKRSYWRDVEQGESDSTAESATGLGDLGRVRLLEAPHSESNYLMQEMGFRIARKHAEKLRRFVVLAGFAGPALLVLVGAVLPGILGLSATLLAVSVLTAGLLVERWLFFAEAKHVVTLYYGEAAA